jgi:nucleotide-binding universal stress UspA family protein
VVVATHPMGRLIGFIWMGLGIVMYVVYRKAKGYSLTRTVEKVVVPETMQEDIDYDQLLVPIVGSRISDEMMVLACQLATEKHSSIDALYVIEVPIHLPLDAPLEEERQRAERAMKAARVIASQFKVKLTPVVVTARNTGRAIVQEADKRRSEVIILGTVRKRRIADRVFGTTVDYVLQHASCEVLVNLVPRDYPTGGSGDAGGAPGGAPRAAAHGGDDSPAASSGSPPA